MSHLILGVPVRWLLAVLTVLGSGAAVVGPDAVVELPAAILNVEDLEPADEPRIEEGTDFTFVSPIKPGISGLAFHPAHLNAGGKCREVYVVRGSLKVHGPGDPVSVTLASDVVAGGEWVESVEVEPDSWDELGSSKPGRFKVFIRTDRETWPEAEKGSAIEVLLSAYVGEETEEAAAEATVFVKSRCKPGKPEKPAKPEKPDKPARPEKPQKPPKPDKPEKPEKPVKPEKPQKPPKPNKNK